MKANRFVTYCFLYSGLILGAHNLITHEFSFALRSLPQLGVALSIFGYGVLRLVYPEEEENPGRYGFQVYGLVALSLFLTVVFLAQLLLVG